MHDEFNQLVFQMYALTRDADSTSYQGRALKLLARKLQFDSAWWGRATKANQNHHVHLSFTFNMPDDVVDRFNVTDPGNQVARTVEHTPGVAHLFDRAVLHSVETTSALSEHMNVSQICCICQVDEATKITNFIALGRHSEEPKFQSADLRILELALPHLTAGLDMSISAQLSLRRNLDQVAMIACDSIGALRAIEPHAIHLLRTEFPNWMGPMLPAPMIKTVADGRRDFMGRQIFVSIDKDAGTFFLLVRPRQKKDFLTKQEKVVAGHFAAGCTYKEVSTIMGISPATVRHHLRSIYLKLDVQDKAQLANKLTAG